MSTRLILLLVVLNGHLSYLTFFDKALSKLFVFFAHPTDKITCVTNFLLASDCWSVGERCS